MVYCIKMPTKLIQIVVTTFKVFSEMEFQEAIMSYQLRILINIFALAKNCL